jgi:hypothetical protein
VADANVAANDQQRRYREFLDLLPLTVALAGVFPPASRVDTIQKIKSRRGCLPCGMRTARRGSWPETACSVLLLNARNP